MDFGVAFYTDSDLSSASATIREFSERLGRELDGIDFGTDVENVSIGLILVRTRQGYDENWFAEKKPRHRKLQKISLIDGGTKELRNIFSYYIKFTNEEIDAISTSASKAIEIFCIRLTDSLTNFETPSMKKRNFDLKKFRETILEFIRTEQNKSVVTTPDATRPTS
ncbi:hypothetical protein JIN87_27820 [Pelagicoccus mobilis]|uniref:Uncharacterized protein n=2 Tax=Pelagicoccus mobilis TaxID=415221 RepID=A0A934S6P2_9BACT|nr:hypothetical protein [Pelagicoccus mobilis]